MTARTRSEHVSRITLYVLLMFSGFVISWLMLLANVRSDSEKRSSFITEFEIHGMQVQWGLNLLSVPIIAAVIALA
jgi:hypothetical protein